MDKNEKAALSETLKKAVAGRENKPHIGIFGRCNSGKSSLLNFIVGAEVAIVSPESGTTTDVVRKSYEIIDFAPVVFVDTAGVDDVSVLGQQRVRKTLETIEQIDLALLVYQSWGEEEQKLAERFERAALPYIIVKNRNSSRTETASREVLMGQLPHASGVELDAVNGDQNQRDTLLGEIKKRLPGASYKTPSMFEGRVGQGDTVLLVCPIDSEAPAGRLILPQVQAVRELLDRFAVAVVVQPQQLERVFADGVKPRLVVVDSQIMAEVAGFVPPGVELTSFSILLAAAKGDFALYTKGLERVDTLRDGDRVLIAESCSHQVSCDDIGRVKIPMWLEQYTGRKLVFEVVSGLSPLPDDLEQFALMVQCGGCMVTRSQLQNRIRKAAEAGVAVTNYGMLIAKLRMKK